MEDSHQNLAFARAKSIEGSYQYSTWYLSTKQETQRDATGSCRPVCLERRRATHGPSLPAAASPLMALSLSLGDTPSRREEESTEPAATSGERWAMSSTPPRGSPARY